MATTPDLGREMTITFVEEFPAPGASQTGVHWNRDQREGSVIDGENARRWKSQ